MITLEQSRVHRISFYEQAWLGALLRASCAIVASAVFVFAAEAKNCDNLKPVNPDPAVTLTISQDASFGTVARPDAGSGTSLIVISPTGVRSIPPNLVINRDLSISGRQPQAATGQITGGPSCDVTVNVSGTTGSLLSVTLRNSQTGTNFTSGTRVRLDGTGNFAFTVGVSQDVAPSTPSIGGTVTIQVNY